jgi:uncharacterized membrane protein
LDARVFALLSAACFGINPVVLKAGLGKGESHMAVYAGLLTGFPILFLLAPTLGGFQWELLTWEAALYFALGGVAAVFLGRMTLYIGIERIGSARASTFKNAAPVFTALLAMIFLAERVDGLRWLGIASVTLGLIMVGQKARQQTVNRMTASGLIIAILSAVFYGLRPLFSKLGLNIAPMPVTSSLVQYIAAAALYTIFLLATRQFGSLPSRRSLTFFAIGGVLQTIGVIFLQYGLSQSDVSAVYPVSASAPLLTFLLSYTLLRNDERLTAWDLLGTVIAVLGVAVLLNA